MSGWIPLHLLAPLQHSNSEGWDGGDLSVNVFDCMNVMQSGPGNDSLQAQQSCFFFCFFLRESIHLFIYFLLLWYRRQHALKCNDNHLAVWLCLPSLSSFCCLQSAPLSIHSSSTYDSLFPRVCVYACVWFLLAFTYICVCVLVYVRECETMVNFYLFEFQLKD